MKTITLASTLILGLATAGLSQTAQAGTLDLNDLTFSAQTQATPSSSDLLIRVVDGDDHWPSEIAQSSKSSAPLLNLDSVFGASKKPQQNDWAQIERDYGTGNHQSASKGTLIDLFSKI